LCRILGFRIEEFSSGSYDGNPFWNFFFMTEQQQIDYSEEENVSILRDNQQDTIIALLNRLRYPAMGHHSNSNDPYEVWHSEIVFERQPGIFVVRNPDMVNAGTSPGCRGTTALIDDLLRSVNIPVFREEHRLSDGVPHGGLYFPSIDMILVHGDDIYNRGLGAVDSYGLLASSEEWEALQDEQ